MKLSEDAKLFAKAVYDKAFVDIAVQGEIDIKQIRAIARIAKPKVGQAIDHYVGITQKCVAAKINAYIQAYEMDGTPMDKEDEDEIFEELDYFIKAQERVVLTRTGPEFMIPFIGQRIQNINPSISAKYDRLRGLAKVDLIHARNTLNIELKKRARLIEESRPIQNGSVAKNILATISSDEEEAAASISVVGSNFLQHYPRSA